MKEGTFMWAVAQMRKGKKVRREVESSDLYLSEELTKGVPLWFQNGKLNPDLHFNFEDIEATDWVVVDDDKEWNLAEQQSSSPLGQQFLFGIDAAKCRDLIIKDINNMIPAAEKGYIDGTCEIVRDIINKRFGSLK